MTEARLKTEVLVQAGFRYCQQALLAAVLRRRGDADAGALLVKVSRLDGTAARSSPGRNRSTVTSPGAGVQVRAGSPRRTPRLG